MMMVIDDDDDDDDRARATMDTLKFEVLMAVLISLVCCGHLETQSDSFFETPAFSYQSTQDITK